MPPPPGPRDVLSATPGLDEEAIPTVLLSHAPAMASTPPRQLLAGTGPRLSRETDALRRTRLRSAALFYLVACFLFLIWRVTLSDDKGLWWLNVAVIAGMAILLVILSESRPISHRGLLAVEVVMFSLLAVFMAVRLYYGMRQSIAFEEKARSITEQAGMRLTSAITVTVKDALILASIVAFSYGMMIPNTWRRAAAVVVGIMLVPLATQLFVFASMPGSLGVARQAATKAGLGENVVYMLVVSGLTIYGTQVINTLRVEAFQARQVNQYRLGEKLGAGGMGEVYRAEHQMLKRPCAIKLIKPDRAADAQALARFEREVRATARLTHPNTVEIYDYGHTEDGTFFYVMELLRGMSLGDMVERLGPLPPGRVVYLLRQACDALAEAHAAGLIHRDLKPCNLFAAFRGGRYDVAKILDFGLVKGGDEPDSPALSREGMVRGTPHYMSPEQAMADPDLDARCDLYAMGAVAYYLITGRPPFDGESAARVMISHVRDPVDPPSRRRKDLPADLEAVILRCLAKDRDARYPSAEALSEALAACACATEWDRHRSAEWWRSIDPTLG